MLSAPPARTQESLATCKFATRCASLAHEVLLNEEEDPSAVLERVQKENRRLRMQLERDALGEGRAPLRTRSPGRPHRTAALLQTHRCRRARPRGPVVQGREGAVQGADDGIPGGPAALLAAAREGHGTCRRVRDVAQGTLCARESATPGVADACAVDSTAHGA